MFKMHKVRTQSDTAFALNKVNFLSRKQLAYFANIQTRSKLNRNITIQQIWTKSESRCENYRAHQMPRQIYEWNRFYPKRDVGSTVAFTTKYTLASTWEFQCFHILKFDQKITKTLIQSWPPSPHLLIFFSFLPLNPLIFLGCPEIMPIAIIGTMFRVFCHNSHNELKIMSASKTDVENGPIMGY